MKFKALAARKLACVVILVSILSASANSSESASSTPAPRRLGFCERILRAIGVNEPTAVARLRAVIEHQNGLRNARSLPPLTWSVDAASADISSLMRGREIIIPSSSRFVEDGESTIGLFLLVGDTLIRGLWGDTYSLNYVYSFEGRKISRAQPYLEWLLEGVAGEHVTLYRNVGPEEQSLWLRGDAQGLQKNSADWGYGQRVLHFSTAPTDISVGQRPKHTIQFRVPKESLRKWLSENAAWGGYLTRPQADHEVVSEIVVSSEKIDELFLRANMTTLP